MKTQKFTTNYRPEDDVTCTNPQALTADPQGSATVRWAPG